jgi:hypothetical protein
MTSPVGAAHLRFTRRSAAMTHVPHGRTMTESRNANAAPEFRSGVALIATRVAVLLLSALGGLLLNWSFFGRLRFL